ncbi:MAG: DNA repair protein RadC [bacterium]
MQAIRYPVMVPDMSRQRLLLRLGLISQKGTTKDAMREWFEVGYELSHATGENTLGLNLLFGVFSGLNREVSKARPVCLEKPRCESCLVTSYCNYFRLVRPQSAKPPSRRIKTLAPADRPREKLLNLGSEALTETELLSIILRTGREEISALDLARELLNRFGDLEGVDQASIQDLCKVGGIGPAKAAEIKAALEISRRLGRKSFTLGTKFTEASQVFEAFRLRFLNVKQEQFVVLALDTKNRLVKDFTVTKGTLRTTAVDPQVVYKHAIQVSASAVIFLHNHPSGDPEPSPEDRKITQQLLEAGKTLGIRILDHIIIGASEYYSFAEEGLLQ